MSPQFLNLDGMEALLSQLLERAEAEGGEGWIRRCLSLPPAAEFAEGSTMNSLMEEPSEVLMTDFTEVSGGREDSREITVPGQQSEAEEGEIIKAAGRSTRKKGQKRSCSPAAPSVSNGGKTTSARKTKEVVVSPQRAETQQTRSCPVTRIGQLPVHQPATYRDGVMRLIQLDVGPQAWSQLGGQIMSFCQVFMSLC